MDWRGQGLSSRVSKNIRIGHIDNFKTFDDDFIKIVEEFFKTRCPSPFIGFGHSMGGCLWLLTLYLKRIYLKNVSYVHRWYP